jgi:hypothetical protein
MRPRIVAAITALALLGAAPAALPAVQHAPAQSAVAVAAKPCSKGYTHAVIGGEHKCLRRGQFCAKRYRNQYRSYGFRCVWDGQYYRLK